MIHKKKFKFFGARNSWARKIPVILYLPEDIRIPTTITLANREGIFDSLRLKFYDFTKFKTFSKVGSLFLRTDGNITFVTDPYSESSAALAPYLHKQGVLMWIDWKLWRTVWVQDNLRIKHTRKEGL